ncbi:MAG TPA: hypothetical protein VIY73_18190 [Polyangiaceae bacterium]
MPHTNKGTETAAAARLLAGFQKHLASVTSLTLGSVVYTPAQLIAALELLLNLRAAVLAAQATAKAKLTAEEAQAPALLVLTDALTAYVRVAFSESPDVLADFGLEPKRAPTPLTAEKQAAANAKRKATRAARGITTKAERMAKTGNVVGVIITPVLAPASPAPVVTQDPATPSSR